MQTVNIVLLCFAGLAAVDRIFGSRLGIGKEFEKGISMAGILILAMAGMLVLCPVITDMLMAARGASGKFFDFSIIPAVLLANDMGATQISAGLAASEKVGALNGLVTASMMGATVSATLPLALQMTEKVYHKDIIFGILCGIITMPIGVLVAGFMIGVDALSLLFVFIPLVLLSLLLAVGITRFEGVTVKLFIGLGLAIRAVITFGLFVGIVRFVTGFEIIKGTEPLEGVMKTLVSIMCVMVGAFPLLRILERVLGKPLSLLGRGLGISETSAFAMLVTLGTTITTLEMIHRMDRRGIVINSAFMVSAAFVFIDHLAWTMAVAPAYTLTVVVAKFVSGISAVALAFLMCKLKGVAPADKAVSPEPREPISTEH